MSPVNVPTKIRPAEVDGEDLAAEAVDINHLLSVTSAAR